MMLDDCLLLVACRFGGAAIDFELGLKGYSTALLNLLLFVFRCSTRFALAQGSCFGTRTRGAVTEKGLWSLGWICFRVVWAACPGGLGQSRES